MEHLATNEANQQQLRNITVWTENPEKQRGFQVKVRRSSQLCVVLHAQIDRYLKNNRCKIAKIWQIDHAWFWSGKKSHCSTAAVYQKTRLKLCQVKKKTQSINHKNNHFYWDKVANRSTVWKIWHQITMETMEVFSFILKRNKITVQKTESVMYSGASVHMAWLS